MTHVTCRLTDKNRDRLRNPTLCSRVYGLPLPFSVYVLQRKIDSAIGWFLRGNCTVMEWTQWSERLGGGWVDGLPARGRAGPGVIKCVLSPAEIEPAWRLYGRVQFAQ